MFGSNLAGRHGAGAARQAMQQFGARYGIGEGPTGQCYAIPTKDSTVTTLPLDAIKVHVEKFLDFAEENGYRTFLLTEIGCGLAGYSPKDIAPFFRNAPLNVVLPERFKSYI